MPCEPPLGVLSRELFWPLKPLIAAKAAKTDIPAITASGISGFSGQNSSLDMYAAWWP